MAKNSYIHRIFAYIRHCLTAWNTTGEGIHSPYLFELVRFILRDENSYYCFADIERRREALMACEDVLDVVDFGSAGSVEGLHVQRRVCDIAQNHLESPKVGQLLFRLVVWMGQQEKKPLSILELGTSLGITTAYLAAANSRNQVTTLEGSGAVLKVAQGSKEITYVRIRTASHRAPARYPLRLRPHGPRRAPRHGGLLPGLHGLPQPRQDRAGGRPPDD